MRYRVTKLNGKLVIVENDEVIYHMPFWVKVNSRADLQRLADSFNQKDERDICDIIEFETRYSTKGRRPY